MPEDLLEEGAICSRDTAKRIMRDIGLCSRIKCKFVVIPISVNTTAQFKLPLIAITSW